MKPNLTVMKYGVNRVTLVGNVGEVPMVSEQDGEAFVANFPLATNEVWLDKQGEMANILSSADPLQDFRY